jgi:diacylglycerol kinase family enzyme
MRIALVVNPHASRFSGRTRDRVAKALAEGHKVELVQTHHPGEAAVLARAAVADGVELAAVLGGDGTVNEVVNGLAGSGALLGLLGGGHTNVLARGLGLATDPERAVGRLLELLAAGARRTISLGVADGRYFTFAAGLGLDGAVVREVERRQRAKQLYGDRAYVAAGLKTLLVDYDREHPHLTVHLQGGRPALRGFFALAGNGDPFSYLGRRPFRPTPDAAFEGGLELLVGQTMATRTLVRAITGMLSPRPRSAYPGLPVLHDEDGFALTADVPLAFQLDGEYLGDRTSVRMDCARRALTVVAPPPRRHA